MKQHIRSVHQGDQPKYVCHVCEQKYFKGSDLTKHLISAHSFSCPSGHSRFRYTKDSTGLFRLQTIRFESLQLEENVPLESVSPVNERRGRKRKKEEVEGEAVKKLRPTVILPPEQEPEEEDSLAMETFDPLMSVKVGLILI